MKIKSAFVTGAAGFVGRHMVKELLDRGWTVVGVDPSMPANGKSYHPYGISQEDCREWFRLSEGYPPFDLIVHCAYHVGGRASIDGVNMNLVKNLHLDAAMFDWAVRTKQPRILYFSSSAVYPVKFQTWENVVQYDLGRFALQENLLIPGALEDPDADYGFAKLVGERLAARARAMGVNVHVVRPFSGYGEDQDPEQYPFPAIVKRAREGDLSVWGPKGQTRDWIHIDDVVKGALAVVDADCQEPVNLCTGVPTEMGDLAAKIWYEQACRTLLSQPDHTHVMMQPQVTYQEDKPTGVFYRVGDPTRMLKYYTPQITLEEGIRRALAS